MDLIIYVETDTRRFRNLPCHNLYVILRSFGDTVPSSTDGDLLGDVCGLGETRLYH